MMEKKEFVEQYVLTRAGKVDNFDALGCVDTALNVYAKLEQANTFPIAKSNSVEKKEK